MMSARSFEKLLLLLPFMLAMTIAMTSETAEARRAYQTVDKQDFLDSSADTSDSNENQADTVTPAPTVTKKVSIQKSDKQSHQTPVKSAPGQLLTTPLDCMMQFETERQADLSNHSTSQSASNKSSAAKSSNVMKSAPAVKKKVSTHDKTSDLNVVPASRTNTSGSPVETAVTALAIGICCYSLSKRFLFKLKTEKV